MNPHDGGAARTPRPGAGGAHDRCGVSLTEAEQRCFEQIVAPMRTLRIMRGRRSAILHRDRTWLVTGLAGILFALVSLSMLPVAVSFAGFLLAVFALAELTRSAGTVRWWHRVRASLRRHGSAATAAGDGAA